MKQTRLTLATLGFLVAVLLATAITTGSATANSFNIDVIKVGQGDVTVDPPGPYSSGQVVTLTAKPDPGWKLESWSLLDESKWWNQDWDYRVPLTVDADGYARDDKPAEVEMNFTALLASLGKAGTFDPNSIRVIEVDGDGNTVDENVVFQFDKGTGYIADSNAVGNLIWIMAGTTGANESRTYHVYFDLASKGFVAPVFTPRVVLEGTVSDESQASFKIATDTGTYFYHQKGAGFSSLDDVDGNDWINYNTTAGAAGTFRGIPNLVHPNNGGHFHPGARSAETLILNEGPIKLTVYSIVRKNPSRWEGTWSFYPEYATLNLTIASYDYWFLYEGTPGGKLDLTQDYMELSDGTKYQADQSWSKDLPGDEWVYFVDPGLDRSLFFANHQDDNKTDSYAPADGVMTKLGFGRVGADQLISKDVIPAKYTIGLMDVTGRSAAEKVILSAYKPLDVTVGEAEKSEGGAISQDNPLEFTVVADHQITATFVPIEYAIDVTIDGGGSVQKTPDQAKYPENVVVALNAVADPGWIFVGWDGDLSGTITPQNLTMTEDKAVTARFKPAVVVTTNTTSGQGQIVLDPPGGVYAQGTAVQLTAVGSPGWRLEAWGGDLAGQTANPLLLTVSDDTLATASFVEEEYELNVSIDGQGSTVTTPDKATYKYGDSVKLDATANTGFAFTGWSGDIVSPDNPLLFNITGTTNLTATFAPLNDYELNVTVVGQGTVTKNPNQTLYQTGQLVVLTAAGAPGWRFTGWSGDVTGTSSPAQILITSDKEVTATFVQEGFPVDISIVGDGAVTKTPNKSVYGAGEQVTLQATAEPGWRFSGWGGDLTGMANPTTITVNDATEIVATFLATGPFKITKTVQGQGVIKALPDKINYNVGETVRLTAEPAPGWVFGGWNSPDLTSNENPVNIVMDTNKTVKAVFLQAGGLVSDNFNSCELDSRWTFINPLDDATATVDGTKLTITVPGGTDHNVWKDGNFAPRIMQAAANLDFQIVVKFDSAVTLRSQMQGILVEQNADNFVRVDLNTNGLETRAYAATFTDGQPKNQFTTSLGTDPGLPLYLRLTRLGNDWTVHTSTDGTTWQLAGTFAHELVVTEMGVFAGNVAGTAPAPEHTAVVDYFFNTAEQSSPADQPLLSTSTLGQGQVRRSPDKSTYACGDEVMLTAVPGNGWSFDSWAGAVNGGANPVSITIESPVAVTAIFENNGGAGYLLQLPMIVRP